MKKIHVALGVHAYDIEIAAGLLPQVGSKVAALLPKGAQGCNYQRYKCCTVICSKITG